jgi:hypothetical protein
MRNKLCALLILLGVIAFGAGTTPISNLKLVGNADGGGVNFTNLDSVITKFLILKDQNVPFYPINDSTVTNLQVYGLVMFGDVDMNGFRFLNSDEIYSPFEDVTANTNLVFSIKENKTAYRTVLDQAKTYQWAFDFSRLDFTKGIAKWRTMVTVVNTSAVVVMPNGGSIYYFTTPNYIVTSNQTVYTQWEAWVDVFGATNIWSNQYEVK